MIKGIAMKGRRIILPFLWYRHVLEQLHSNHMCIEIVRLLMRELVYGVNMNADIENTMKLCATCLEYQQTLPQEKTIPYEVSCKPWKVVGADIFLLLWK